MRVRDIAVTENAEPNPAVTVAPSPLITVGAVTRGLGQTSAFAPVTPRIVRRCAPSGTCAT